MTSDEVRLSKDTGIDPRSTRTPLFELRLLGPTRVLKDDVDIHLGMSEIVLLTTLGAASSWLTNQEVMELGWGTNATTRVLSSALYRVRRVLGVEAIQRVGGRLRLNRDVVMCDVDQFQSLTQSLDPASVVEALSLVDGTPFASMNTERWEERRRLWTDMCVQLVTNSVEQLEREGDSKSAAYIRLKLAGALPLELRASPPTTLREPLPRPRASADCPSDWFLSQPAQLDSSHQTIVEGLELCAKLLSDLAREFATLVISSSKGGTTPVEHSAK